MIHRVNDCDRCVKFSPGGEGRSRQRGVSVAWIVRDFLDRPVGQFEGFLLALELDLGEEKPLVVEVELIDRPEFPVKRGEGDGAPS